MNKQELRKKYFQQFSDYQQNADHELAENLIKERIDRFFNEKIGFKLMAYQPLKSELPVIRLLEGIDCELYIPDIQGTNLVPKSLSAGDFRQIEEMDFVVVPGLYVTPAGFRLGRGGGYYDRLLTVYPRNKTLFVGYDWQIIPSLPLDPWDMPAGFLITEKRTSVVPG